MTVTATPSYGTSSALTCTLASLASDPNLVAGRESLAVDNTSDLAMDALLGGFITTGTTPTNLKQIEIWVIGSWDGTTFSAGATGTDANFSPTANEKVNMKLATILQTDATSNHQYEFGPFSVAQLFGGLMPKKWSVYVVHNTAVALNSNGANHSIKYTPVKYQSA